jgi:hypothetical protein
MNITVTATPAPTPAAIPAEDLDVSGAEEGAEGASVAITRPVVGVMVDALTFVGLLPPEGVGEAEVDVLTGPVPA